MGDPLVFQVVLAIIIIMFLIAAYLTRNVLSHGMGNQEMQGIAAAISEGAKAFLRRQYKTVALLAIVVAIILFIAFYATSGMGAASITALAFLFGAACSAISGIFGMTIAVRANIRTAAAAEKSSATALQIALRGGAVSGLTIVSLSLLGIFLTYYVLELMGATPQTIPLQIVGFGFGASFVALFAQLGGGIYTKAADVGADLVGKVEASIPEDDPRNPAVIADLVGDNVGDCAGRGADLFESITAENVGAMILGVALFPVFGEAGILFALVACAFGLIASTIGVFSVRPKEDEDPVKPLIRGYYVTAVIAAALLYVATMWLLKNIWFFYAGITGIVLSVVILFITLYYTEHKYRPVKEIAQASETGEATNILTGISVGFECVALPVVAISAALLISYYFGEWSGVYTMVQLGGQDVKLTGGIFGTAVATVGMLSTAAYILAMDTFGPIADNAGGIVEMSNAPKGTREKIDRLDAVGNTTKALTKGYAIGSAALAAFLLFSSYMEAVSQLRGEYFGVVNLANVPVFIGALLGATLVFLFASFAIRAVSKTAGYIISEVRRQFADGEILAGKRKPDYGTCVDITTTGALRNMVLPGALAVAFPIFVGAVLKYEAMAAFLMVGTIGGILVANLMNNGGGAWDNAKKFIESGAFGGKGSPAHKAAVVGDTVGDPFKDTAGPSIHVLIKLLATLTLVLAPLYI